MIFMTADQDILDHMSLKKYYVDTKKILGF